MRQSRSLPFLISFPSALGEGGGGTYAGGLEGGVAVDDGLDGEFGFLAVERDGDVGDLECVLGHVARRVGRLDGAVELGDVRIEQRGGRVAHLDEEQHALVLVFAWSTLSDDDAVADELEFLDNAVDLRAAKAHSRLR